ncbi:MAG: hypothetical protein ACXWJW_16120, partial [Xanthobacteraceae bacterium]
MRRPDTAIPGGGCAGATTEPARARVVATSNFLTIQALRAVAALLVVVHHAFDMWGERVNTMSSAPPWTNGAAGVDIFFV